MTSPKISAKGSRAGPPARRAKGEAAPDPQPFWRRKTLAEMTRGEWESLCDGCARCCLVKLEYDDTGEVDHTEIACRLLDLKTCQCSDYPHRRQKVSDCLSLTPAKVRRLTWLPATCAYRLVAAGRDLYWWHHLVSGDRETVHQAGISVRGRVISEDKAGPPEEHIIDWID
jgi:uncharacterized protein